jgi:hypothetical protein
MKLTRRQLRRLISEAINSPVGSIPFDQNLKFEMPSKAPEGAVYAQVRNNKDGSPELVYFLDINKQPIQGGINIKALANYFINPTRVNDALSDINIFINRYAVERVRFDEKFRGNVRDVLLFGLLGLALEDSSIITVQDYEASDLLMLLGMLDNNYSDEGPDVKLKDYLNYITDHLTRLYKYSESY